MLKQVMMRVTCAALLVVMISAGAAFVVLASSSVATSETSSVSFAATVTPPYVSELAPAVVVQPQQAAALPVSGAGPYLGAANPLPRAAGLALLLLGGLLVRTGLTWRSGTNR